MSNSALKTVLAVAGIVFVVVATADSLFVFVVASAFVAAAAVEPAFVGIVPGSELADTAACVVGSVTDDWAMFPSAASVFVANVSVVGFVDEYVVGDFVFAGAVD